MPTCWCCRDDRRPPRPCRRDARRPGLATGHGPVPRRPAAVDGGALAAASALAVLTTVCCAWRWRIVARGLGVDLPLGTAVAAYYRSLFLNVTLPGGVVGDVHRGISHGRERATSAAGCAPWRGSARPGRPCRSSSPSPCSSSCRRRCRAAMPLVALALLAAAAGVALAARVRPAAGRWARLRSTAARELRDGLLAGAGVAGHRARVGAGRRGPRGHVPDRRADRGGDRAAVPDAAAGAARAGGRGAAQRRRLGAARGRDGVGVRRRRPGRVCRGRHRGRLRRDGVRRHPAGRRRPRRRLARRGAAHV